MDAAVSLPADFDTMPRATDDLAAILYTSGTTRQVQRCHLESWQSGIECSDAG